MCSFLYGLERGLVKVDDEGNIADKRGAGQCLKTGLPYNPPWRYAIQAEAFPAIAAEILCQARRQGVEAIGHNNPSALGVARTRRRTTTEGARSSRSANFSTANFSACVKRIPIATSSRAFGFFMAVFIVHACATDQSDIAYRSARFSATKSANIGERE